MPETPLTDLIQKYLDDQMSADEFRDLESRLAANPDDADAFARACRVDAILQERFTEEKQIDQSTVLAHRAIGDLHAADDYLPAAPRRRRYPVLAWATAVIVLIALGVVGWFALPRPTLPTPNPEVAQQVHRLLSGRALVDGKEVDRIPDGARVESLDEPAVIVLKDGSRAELAPESSAILRGQEGDIRQVVSLLRGGATFKVEKGRRQFQVKTPVGDVTVLGTEFAVQLQEFQTFVGDDEMLLRSFLTLAVVVTTGQVEVQIGERLLTLSAGQSQVFADEKPAADNFDRRADVTGKLVKYDEKAGTMVVARKENQGDVTFAVAKDAKVFAEKANTKLGDIPENQTLMLYLNEDRSTIVAVRVGAAAPVVDGGRRDGEGDGPLRGAVIEVNAAKNTISLRFGERASNTYQLAKEVQIQVDGKPAKLEEVKENQAILVTLNAEKQVATIKAGKIPDGELPASRRKPTMQGLVGKYDAQNNTLEIIIKGDAGERKMTFNVAKEVRVSVNGREMKMSEVPQNIWAGYYLNDDRSTVVALIAEAKPDRRIIQSVDLKKKTVQFRAEGRDLIFPLGENVKVFIDGKESKLADIQPDSPASVTMSPDRSTVLAIEIGKGGRRDAPREGDKPRDGDKPREGDKKPDAEKPIERKPDGEKPAVRRPDGEKPNPERKPDGEKPPVRRPDGEKPNPERKVDGEKPNPERKPDGEKPPVRRPDGEK